MELCDVLRPKLGLQEYLQLDAPFRGGATEQSSDEQVGRLVRPC